MKILELDPEGGWLLKAIRRHRDEEAARTGLHVSTICDDIYQTLYPGAFAKGMSEEQMWMFQEVGNAVEEIIAKELARKMGWEKPAPRTGRHGVTGSPDGYHAQSRTLHEMKATWVSEREFLESPKFQRYCWQSLRYIDDDLFPADRIKLHVFFVCGTHRPPIPTKPKTWTLVPTKRDVTDNTRMLETHARDRGWI